MEETQGIFFRQERLLGRKVIVILPIFILIVVVTMVYLTVPQKYFFSVNDGKLCLETGRFTWLGGQRCEIIEPIPARDLNVGSLTGQIFASQSEALVVLREFFLPRIQEQNQQVLAIEKELVKPYTLLLRDLKAARSAGAEGVEKQANALQGWLEVYSDKVKKAQ